MRTNLNITIAIIATIISITAAWLSVDAMKRVARAEPEASGELSSPAQEPGLFCFPQYHCTGGDCENGILDAYKLDVPDHLSICAVDFFVTGSSIPFSRLGNGCDKGLCTFGMPFGPTLRAYSQPHDPAVVGIRVWTEPRQKRHAPVIMWNWPYPYP